MRKDDMLSMMEEDSAPPEPPPSDDPTMARLVLMGDELERCKSDLDEIKKHEKAVRERYDTLRLNLIPDMMHKVGIVGDDGRGRFSLSSGALISLRTDLHAGYSRENEEKIFAWLRKNNMGDIIRLTVHPQTFKSVIREQLAEGRSIPEFVNQYYETSATLRRS